MMFQWHLVLLLGSRQGSRLIRAINHSHMRLLLLTLALAACSSAQTPFLTRSAPLSPGATLVVSNVSGDINAYAPEHNAPQDRFTVAAYGEKPAGASVSVQSLLVRVQAQRAGVRFLVRAPGNTAMNLSTRQGNIGVEDFNGVVNAHTDTGDIKMLIPQYGNASIGTGNLNVIFASDKWPGTLHFSVDRGTAVVYVNQDAKAHVRVHTDDGSVFSDFNITGSSTGSSETIDTNINGGGPRGVDVEVHKGDIRLMQLKPQM
jgi:hypothetical protein